MGWFLTPAQLQVLVAKMKTIVLMHSPIIEIHPWHEQLHDLWRRETRGEFDDDIPGYMALRRAHMDEGEKLDRPEMAVMWENFTDIRGDNLAYKGWHISTTLYALRGQPWWLLRASRAKVPTDANLAALEHFVELMGADPERDRLVEIWTETQAEMEGGPAIALFTWFNRDPLMELHVKDDMSDLEGKSVRAIKKQAARGNVPMKPMPEGTPPEEGWHVEKRFGMAEIEDMWARRDAKDARVDAMKSSY